MKSLDESALTSRKGAKFKFVERRTCIVVGIKNPRTRLRVSVLLSAIPEYHVRYISCDDEISAMIEDADLIIGTGAAAREGVLRRKPVIVVGDYGFGGLVTPDTFRYQYNNSFRGKINGTKDEYFSLERLEEEIKKGFNLSFQELQMMSNQTVTFLNT